MNWRPGEQALHTDDRDGESEQSTHRRENKTFGEEQANQAAAARANGRAHRDLAPACRGAREEQVCDVEAGDEQQQRRRREQREQSRTEHAGDLIIQANDAHSPTAIRRWKLTSEARR